ncbi:basic salivary proline-rich protein 2-like [Chironomus tepperi]|uniref:basic salivary proline-rich protein 2-like n=1 Tax=Chironomus tepperi TaxID=113505 RepID=UPI00391F7D2E
MVVTSCRMFKLIVILSLLKLLKVSRCEPPPPSSFYNRPSSNPQPFAPTLTPDTYGPPSQNFNGLNTGFISSTPSKNYGPPSQSSSNSFGPPSQAPSNSYGPPSQAPSNTYGPPSQTPSNSYGSSSQAPSNSYGPPSQPPSNSYGPPSQPPSNSYGPPAQNPSNSYGPPTLQPEYGAPSADTTPSAVVHKHVYVHIPPPEPDYTNPEYPIKNPVQPVQKHYRIIFIKAPTQASPTIPPLPPIQSSSEEKTIVYVLVKKPDDLPEIILPTPATTPPTKPEVYFIRYKTEADKSTSTPEIETSGGYY